MRAELCFPFENIMQKKKSIKKELLRQQGFFEAKIAILSGSTVGEIRDTLEVFLLDIGIKPVFWVGAYNRYYEESVFSNESLAGFKPDIVYMHTSVRNIEDTMSESSIFERFLSIWEKLNAAYHCPIIQNNFESPPYTYLDNHGLINRLNMRMQEYAAKNQNFYINDIHYISAYYGLEKWFDETGWHCYKYAMDVNAIPMLAHHIAGVIKSIYSRNQKCLVLDLDNTLWGGIVGEVGPMGIELGMDTAIGEAYTAFQKYVKKLHDIGIILAICSKNEESIAKSAFDHPNMVLKLEDIAVFCANWESKADNIANIAYSLHILPSAIVFIDDSPAEQELVRNALPDVKVPSVRKVTDFVKAIDQGGYFHVTSISHEDLQRNAYYKADTLRGQAQKDYQSYGDYLLSLAMTAEIAPLSKQVMERAAQLINKTNQFNLTAARMTLAEAANMADSPGYITAYAVLEDKFGSNGIVSVLIGKIDEKCHKSLHIQVWVMSCRVFKRDLELAIFDYIVERCRARNISKITGSYKRTDKNSYVAPLLQSLHFVQTGGGEWEYDIPDVYENMNKVIQVRR